MYVLFCGDWAILLVYVLHVENIHACHVYFLFFTPIYFSKTICQYNQSTNLKDFVKIFFYQDAGIFSADWCYKVTRLQHKHVVQR
jgi:hypothetical protein